MQKYFFHSFLLFAAVLWAQCGVAVAATKLDATFGLNGRVAVELGTKNSAHAVVVQPDGKIVVAGSSSQGSTLNFSLLRFNKDGTLDTSFNREGAVTTSVVTGDDEALALGLLSDGRIVAAGYSNNGANRDFAMVCYLANGTLDQSFGDNGVVITPVGNSNDEITALVVNSQDMITVAGAVEGTAGRVLATARYFADGTLDTSYGEQGVSLIGVGSDSAAEGIVERSDGTVVVSGSYEEKKYASLMLVGLTADGTLDATFGERGVSVPASAFAASEGYRLAQDSEGLIYLAGSVGVVGKRDTALFRFTASGKPDTSFGEKGAVINVVSQEDDVLYDVAVGKSGAVASGYTTDAGTRQFLIASYSKTGTASTQVAQTGTTSASSTAISTGTSVSTQEIQEVKVVGETKVQIRKLKVASSLTSQSSASPWTWMRQGLTAVLQELGSFFLPEAIAATSSESTTTETTSTASSVASKVVTTTFSEGESVSYALATDAEGNVVVVGTAEGSDASSIVAARYAADAIAVNQAGFTSSYIYTRPPSDVTRTTVITGGTILPGFDQTVDKRGVVFSTTDTPSYNTSSNSTTDTGPTISSFDAVLSGTTVTLEVVTAEDATCKYDSSDTDYDSMANNLTASADGLTHTGTTPGASGLIYYVRCQGTASGVSNSSSISDTVFYWPQRTYDTLSGLLVKDAVAATTTTTSTDDSISTDSTSTTSSTGSIFGATATSDSEDESDFVEEGQTENGSGKGTFSAKLKKLKPGTTYYVRAYALVGTAVYYGKQETFTTADACFVATASFGTLMHPGVQVLRSFRDTILNSTPLGKHLVATYYTLSPPVADIISQNAALRLLVRVLLLPFVGFSWLAVHAGLLKAFLLAVCAGTGLARVIRTFIQPNPLVQNTTPPSNPA